MTLVKLLWLSKSKNNRVSRLSIYTRLDDVYPPSCPSDSKINQCQPVNGSGGSDWHGCADDGPYHTSHYICIQYFIATNFDPLPMQRNLMKKLHRPYAGQPHQNTTSRRNKYEMGQHTDRRVRNPGRRFGHGRLANECTLKLQVRSCASSFCLLGET